MKLPSGFQLGIIGGIFRIAVMLFMTFSDYITRV